MLTRRLCSTAMHQFPGELIDLRSNLAANDERFFRRLRADHRLLFPNPVKEGLPTTHPESGKWGQDLYEGTANDVGGSPGLETYKTQSPQSSNTVWSSGGCGTYAAAKDWALPPTLPRDLENKQAATNPSRRFWLNTLDAGRRRCLQSRRSRSMDSRRNLPYRYR